MLLHDPCRKHTTVDWLHVASNIIPNANVTYSLGNSTNQWKDLWISNNTIYINNIPLTIDANNNLSVNNNPITGGGVLTFPITQNDYNSPIRFYFHDHLFKKFDWTVEPDVSLQNLYKLRAQQIRDEYDYVILSFSGGSGTGATATATVAASTISALTIGTAGTGYSAAPTITIAAPPSGTTATATGATSSC